MMEIGKNGLMNLDGGTIKMVIAQMGPEQ